MCCLCCWIRFWHTQYNTPRTFCLASYSVVFCDPCAILLLPTDHSNCMQALGSDSSDKHTTLSHTNWQVGFVVKGSTTCFLSIYLRYLTALEYTFFPLHLLHRYNHRSYQWSDPRGPEQACLDEPSLAELRRLTSFGSVTRLILLKRRTV